MVKRVHDMTQVKGMHACYAVWEDPLTQKIVLRNCVSLQPGNSISIK